MKLILLLLISLGAMAAKNKTKLNPELKNSYLKLLNQAGGFHKAISEGDQTALQKETKETQEIIAELYRKSSALTEFHFRIHSHKLLKSIEEQLAMINRKDLLKENQEKKAAKKLFNSFFELAQVYDLTKDMKDRVFYCVKDKSLWFQTDKKAQNPINPDYKNCAAPIL